MVILIFLLSFVCNLNSWGYLSYILKRQAWSVNIYFAFFVTIKKQQKIKPKANNSDIKICQTLFVSAVSLIISLREVDCFKLLNLPLFLGIAITFFNVSEIALVLLSHCATCLLSIHLWWDTQIKLVNRSLEVTFAI